MSDHNCIRLGPCLQSDSAGKQYECFEVFQCTQHMWMFDQDSSSYLKDLKTYLLYLSSPEFTIPLKVFAQAHEHARITLADKEVVIDSSKGFRTHRVICVIHCAYEIVGRCFDPCFPPFSTLWYWEDDSFVASLFLAKFFWGRLLIPNLLHRQRYILWSMLCTKASVFSSSWSLSILSEKIRHIRGGVRDAAGCRSKVWTI